MSIVVVALWPVRYKTEIPKRLTSCSLQGPYHESLIPFIYIKTTSLVLYLETCVRLSLPGVGVDLRNLYIIFGKKTFGMDRRTHVSENTPLRFDWLKIIIPTKSPTAALHFPFNFSGTWIWFRIFFFLGLAIENSTSHKQPQAPPGKFSHFERTERLQTWSSCAFRQSSIDVSELLALTPYRMSFYFSV